MRQRLLSLVMIAVLVSVGVAQSGTRAWYQVLEVKGTASKQTDLFDTKGTKWRVRWRKPTPESKLTIYIYDKSGMAVSVIATKAATDDESYIHKAGTFYLSLNASDGYTVTVEDWR